MEQSNENIRQPRKKKKSLIYFVTLLLLLLVTTTIPLALFFIIAVSSKKAYSDSYYAALKNKYDYLKSIEDEKVVIIGGSSVTFGIDAEVFENYYADGKIPCVTMGLYAAFGLKPMLDLSEEYIGKGDVVIIAPEISSQMYSDYVGYEYLLKAIEGRTDIAFDFGKDYALGFANAYPGYNKAKKAMKNESAAEAGIYALSSFDSKGNLKKEELEEIRGNKNIMVGGFLDGKGNAPEVDEDIITEDFVNMVNDFTAKVSKKGATVYFAFCPLNELSLGDMTDSKFIRHKERFVEKLEEELDCEVISDLSEHIMDASLFYDSNFHTNETGAKYNTILLLNDIFRTQGKMKLTEKLPKIKSASEAGVTYGESSGYSYALSVDGITITGIDESIKVLEKLEVPSMLEGYYVVKIAAGAFDDSKAEEIVLPDSIKALAEKAFTGADKLSKLVILANTLPQVGGDFAANDVEIYVPSSLIIQYKNDYFWGRYSDKLKEYTE